MTYVDSDDYASLQADAWEFYYGYEELDADDKWCFVAKHGGVEKLRLSEPELRKAARCGGFNLPAEALVAGIGLALESGLLETHDAV